MVRDNIDTDQIIPAEYLNLVPTIPEEYEKLGSFALCGLPRDQYPTRFMTGGQIKSAYAVIIAGRNFGCGSSREHAPIALGAAGCNCVATGELYPVETTTRLCDAICTGDEVELDLDTNNLKLVKAGKTLAMRPLGDARPVIDAGGVFEYARKTGMIG